MKYKPYYLKDVYKSAARKLFTSIDCFAGGGGSSMGIKLAGGHELLINEFVESARETFSANFPDVPMLPDDIKQLSGKDFLKAANISEGELDILSGSPPCSAFSMAGSIASKGKHSFGQTKKYSDGKTVENIEDLFLEYIRIAGEIQPKVILGENVQGLEFGAAAAYRNQFDNAFGNIGYKVTNTVLNAADFGTPQTRKRFFFLALRNDIAEDLWMEPGNIAAIFPTPIYNKPVFNPNYRPGDPIPTTWITVSDAFVDLINDPENIEQAKEVREILEKKESRRVLNLAEELEKIYPWKDETEIRKLSLVHPKGHMFNYHRLTFNKPSCTLTQTGLNPGSGQVLYPDGTRPITYKEAIRLMGLPEDYILKGNHKQKMERIGRMVAPQVMQHLAGSVYKNILCHL